MLTFASDDARRNQTAFTEKGLTTYPVFDFSRRAALPGGGEATVAFSLAYVTDDRMPGIAFFACQQHAPCLSERSPPGCRSARRIPLAWSSSLGLKV